MCYRGRRAVSGYFCLGALVVICLKTVVDIKFRKLEQKCIFCVGLIYSVLLGSLFYDGPSAVICYFS